MKALRFFLPILAVTSLTGCPGGGGGSNQGQLSLSLTDAPVDGVAQVWVEFTGVTLKPKSGSAVDYTFDQPVSVDLKTLTGGNTSVLLDSQPVPAGEYEWMRLNVKAEFDGVMDSYVIRDDGGQVELRVPSGSQTGLKLVRGFTVTQGGNTDFVIDWNLRQGLVAPPGQPGYLLQPTLRLVDMAKYGTVSGTVDAALISDTSCTSDPNTGAGNAVYVFQGADVSPDDIDGIAPDPITVANVRLNQSSGMQEYSVSYLEPGDYTVAFTCQAADDNPPNPDDPSFDANDAIQFTAGINVTVENGKTATVNFSAP